MCSSRFKGVQVISLALFDVLTATRRAVLCEIVKKGKDRELVVGCDSFVLGIRRVVLWPRTVEFM